MLLFYYRLEFDNMDNKKTTKIMTNKNTKLKLLQRLLQKEIQNLK